MSSALRIIDLPISENGFAGMGIAAAMYGLRPIVEFDVVVVQPVAADAILNNAPKMLYMSGAGGLPDRVPRERRGGRLQLARRTRGAWRGLYANVPGLKMVIPE